MTDATDGVDAPLQPPALADYDPLPEEQPDERVGDGSGAEPRGGSVLRRLAETDEDDSA